MAQIQAWSRVCLRLGDFTADSSVTMEETSAYIEEKGIKAIFEV